jgi:mono/diheme cytochrome c family protein
MHSQNPSPNPVTENRITEEAMKALKILLLMLAVGFALPSVTAQASNYVNGQVSGAYTYWHGYWYRDGHYYTRYNAGTYACPVWIYRYYAPANGGGASGGSIASTDEGWRKQLLDIAAARDKWESQNKRSAVEHAEFIETAKALGLEGAFSYQNYGSVPFAQGYGGAVLAVPGYGAGVANVAGYSGQQSYAQLPVAQGSTVYGYTQSADVFGNTDIGQLYNMALRLGSESTAAGKEATVNAQNLVGQLGQAATAVEEIRAKAEGVAAIANAEAQATVAKVNALKGSDRANVTTKEFRIENGVKTESGGMKVSPNKNIGDQGANLRRLQGIFQANCVGCHRPGGKHSELNLEDVTKLTDADVDNIISRIETHDLTKRMPQAADGGVAAPLSLEDRRFIIYMGGPGSK